MPAALMRSMTLHVVIGDLVGLREAREVLAEARVQRPDAGCLQRGSGGQRVIDRLAGHEPADGSAHEPEPGKAFLQPAIPGGPQEDPTHAVSSHGRWPTGPCPMVRDESD